MWCQQRKGDGNDNCKDRAATRVRVRDGLERERVGFEFIGFKERNLTHEVLNFFKHISRLFLRSWKLDIHDRFRK